MARIRIARPADRLHDRCFQLVHRNRLIYNTCWEDPRIDRELLEIDDKSRVVVITSAGCNTLDYLLDNPARIDAVDVNYRQNALMALKMATISAGRRDLLVRLFGDGRHPDPRAALAAVADALSERDRRYWRRHIGYFGGRRTFYHRGATGDAAWVFITLFYRFFRGVKPLVDELMSAPDLQAQRAIYERIEPRLWRRPVTWLVKQPTLMAMLGVPRPQMRLIDRQYAGGLPQYVRDRLRHVFTRVPIGENYFWRVYATGTYPAGCRPNYLKEHYFETLRDRIGRVRLHTDTLTGFLEKNPGIYTHFVLLDHQDWMAWYHPEALAAEWTAILANSRSGTRILMRSAGPDVRFIPAHARRSLRFRPELTEPLHRQDRVGTYGSLHLAEVIYADTRVPGRTRGSAPTIMRAGRPRSQEPIKTSEVSSKETSEVSKTSEVFPNKTSEVFPNKTSEVFPNKTSEVSPYGCPSRADTRVRPYNMRAGRPRSQEPIKTSEVSNETSEVSSKETSEVSKTSEVFPNKTSEVLTGRPRSQGTVS